MAMRLIRSAAGLGLLAGLMGVAGAQAATAVPRLDLKRFAGTWYEMARYPIKREKACVGDAVQVIAAESKVGRLQLVTSCSVKDGSTDVHNLSIRTENRSGDGRLKTWSTWPFYTKYWVLEVGPEYEWSLVGSPNHKTLWVLSKTPRLSPEVLAEMESRATAEGYSVGKLVMSPQRVR